MSFHKKKKYPYQRDELKQKEMKTLSRYNYEKWVCFRTSIKPQELTKGAIFFTSLCVFIC